MSDLPTDNQGNVIQALRLGPAAHKIAYTGTSARNTNAFSAGVDVVYLYATSDCYVKFGVNNTVTATTSDFFIPAGQMLPFAIRGDQAPLYSYIAAIQVSASGTLYVSEMF